MNDKTALIGEIGFGIVLWAVQFLFFQQSPSHRLFGLNAGIEINFLIAVMMVGIILTLVLQNHPHIADRKAVSGRFWNHLMGLVTELHVSISAGILAGLISLMLSGVLGVSFYGSTLGLFFVIRPLLLWHTKPRMQKIQLQYEKTAAVRETALSAGTQSDVRITGNPFSPSKKRWGLRMVLLVFGLLFVTAGVLAGLAASWGMGAVMILFGVLPLIAFVHSFFEARLRAVSFSNTGIVFETDDEKQTHWLLSDLSALHVFFVPKTAGAISNCVISAYSVHSFWPTTYYINWPVEKVVESLVQSAVLAGTRRKHHGSELFEFRPVVSTVP